MEIKRGVSVYDLAPAVVRDLLGEMVRLPAGTVVVGRGQAGEPVAICLPGIDTGHCLVDLPAEEAHDLLLLAALSAGWYRSPMEVQLVTDLEELGWVVHLARPAGIGWQEAKPWLLSLAKICDDEGTKSPAVVVVMRDMMLTSKEGFELRKAGIYLFGTGRFQYGAIIRRPGPDPVPGRWERFLLRVGLRKERPAFPCDGGKVLELAPTFEPAFRFCVPAMLEE
ncbi:MAG: hypothetical protein D6800_03100 [Candidatus Zixiibacteriota bacterium]|nr:MAG: hypothetical protein D6800_03100 [candidate division Zixibacteria bacterium]